MGFLLDFVGEIVAEILAAVLPAGKEKLEEWRRSDSPSLRIISVLILLTGILLIGFIIAWIFFL